MAANADAPASKSPAGTPISLAISGPGESALMTVADCGPGIPEAERTQVLERFVRLDRSRSTRGNGLGLSLVAAVAELHGIVLRLEDNRPGLRLVLQF